jgi:hypothetical protein
MSGKQWQTPSVWQISWDELRFMLEISRLQDYTAGLNDPDQVLDAARRFTVDMLDDVVRNGRIPSRWLLGRVSAELKAAYWPEGGTASKQERYSREQGFCMAARAQIDWLAANQYRNASNPRTKAEEKVAEIHGLSVFGLRNRLKRYRDHARKLNGGVED